VVIEANRPEAIVTFGVLVLVAAALLVPPVTELFAFEAVPLRVIALSIAAAVGSLAIARVARRRERHRSDQSPVAVGRGRAKVVRFGAAEQLSRRCP
jgi:multisubunit Na+/H+ antiporter MnhG subunit